ncbi:hypothetical protein [Aeromicrobium sp.]|uniref:hypothetical protein n=1 Tax=Aeromicrobium sp. TaxID=1871063 RepID=UPI002FCB6EB5
MENDDNVAVIAAPVTLEQLFEAEPSVSRLLSEQLVAGPPSRKRWDAFVILLCAQNSTPDHAEAISDLVNNLRFARRLVRVGVEPTKAALSRSLRPLLPPPTATTNQLEQPLHQLERLLVRDGLDPVAVEDAIRDFELSKPAGAMIANEAAAADGEDDPLMSLDLDDEEER